MRAHTASVADRRLLRYAVPLATTSLTYPAICAVTMANAVLVAFIYIAFREDMLDSAREEHERKSTEREKQAQLSKEAVTATATGVAPSGSAAPALGDKDGAAAARRTRRE